MGEKEKAVWREIRGKVRAPVKEVFGGLRYCCGGGIRGGSRPAFLELEGGGGSRRAGPWWSRRWIMSSIVLVEDIRAEYKKFWFM